MTDLSIYLPLQSILQTALTYRQEKFISTKVLSLRKLYDSVHRISKLSCTTGLTSEMLLNSAEIENIEGSQQKVQTRTIIQEIT